MRSALVILVAVPSLVTTACDQPHLGLCDEEVAQQLVFEANGYPAYPGQAMTEQHCTSCHSTRAGDVIRRGSPNHLNFDVVGSRTDDPTMPDMVALAEVVAARQLMFEERYGIFGSVENGTMPPGGIGLGSYVASGYSYPDGRPLEPIASREGIEIYRGWLACGAPMVERSALMGTPGAPCGGADVGDHCYVVDPAEPLDPTFSVIFEEIFVPQCTLCHAPDGGDPFRDSMLDLSNPRIAYDSLVGQEAISDHPDRPCSAVGTVMVIPGDPDGSLLVQKMEGTDASGGRVCGDPMPTLRRPPRELAAIRAWIEMGAMDN